MVVHYLFHRLNRSTLSLYQGYSTLYKSDSDCYCLVSMVTITQTKQVIITKVTWNFIISMQLPLIILKLFIYDIAVIIILIIIDLQSKNLAILSLFRVSCIPGQPRCYYFPSKSGPAGPTKAVFNTRPST